MTLRDANEVVKAIHRHHGPVVGYKFALGLEVEVNGGAWVRQAGVAICGRPVSRVLDDGKTLEVLRVAVLNGQENACSKLYGACARVAREMGYNRIITYTLATEPGTSLKASGWKNDGPAGGGSWSVPSRRRIDKHPTGPKVRWVRHLADHGFCTDCGMTHYGNCQPAAKPETKEGA
jgi:hypothetical protein